MYEDETPENIGGHDRMVEKMKNELDEDSIELLTKLLANKSDPGIQRIERQLERTNKILDDIKDALNRIANK
jgi:hypothetical protein